MSVRILKLLLTYNPNVNLLDQPNNKKYTTMHIAAKKQNVTMMKLLISSVQFSSIAVQIECTSVIGIRTNTCILSDTIPRVDFA